jgi:hypothetical protein
MPASKTAVDESREASMVAVADEDDADIEGEYVSPAVLKSLVFIATVVEELRPTTVDG